MTDILQLIPQRPPMVMVDRFLGFDGETALAVLTVREDNLFTDDGILSEMGLMEHMAQSAAARAGYLARQENRPVAVGYIGSIDRFELEALPQVGDEITTQIKVLQQVYNLSLVEARTFLGGKQLASCRMKIILEDEE